MSLYHNAVKGKWITFRLNADHYKIDDMVVRPRQIVVGQVYTEVATGSVGVYTHQLDGIATYILLEDFEVHGDPLFAAKILEVFDVKPED